MAAIVETPTHYQEGIDPETGLPSVRFSFPPVEVVAQSEDKNSYLFDDDNTDINSTNLLQAVSTQNRVLKMQNRLFTGMVRALSNISRAIKSGGGNSDGNAIQKQTEAINAVGDVLSKSMASLEKTISKSSGNGSGNEVATALNSLKDSLDQIATIKNEVGKILENGGKMLEIETERHNYETKSQVIKDLDGQDVAKISPREAQTIKNASQARVATDTNNFELLDSDLDDLFGDLPDPSGLFAFPMPYEVDKSFIGGS